jgi:predicted amidohydrolase
MALKFRLAMVQMRVDAGCPEVNLARAEERIREAATAGAQIVLLPEVLTLGWTDPSARSKAEPIPEGEACRRLGDSARQNRVYVCAGLVERSGSHIFNAAALFDPKGTLLLHHRKINELDIGRPFYDVGDRLAVTKTPLGTFGVMICADAFAPGQVISRTLAMMGSHMILSPCAWAVPADYNNEREPYGQLWRDNYGPVARDFKIWIAGASNVGWIPAGPWAGRKCIGCSLLVGPDGNQVLMGPYGAEAETVLFAEIK